MDCKYTVYTRREVLELMAKAGAGVGASAVALQAFGWFIPEADAADSVPMRKAMFQTKLDKGLVRCDLCPRNITIKPGNMCFCRTRKNINGELYALGFNSPCLINFDPIERGPIYHFLPGTQSMTMATAGCNMNCQYCQNYELAQTSPDKAKRIDFNVPEACRKGRMKSITLTYTEPAVQPEYLIEISKTAKAYKLPVVVCTAGYINPEPLKALIPHVDAFAVTLKAATDEGYVKLTEVHMDPVLETIKNIRKSGKWLEIVTLVVEGYNDGRDDIRRIARWIRDNAGTDVPWHLSRFTPGYKLKKLPPTQRKTLEEARAEGLAQGLKYVYITNLAPHDGNHTYCPKCKDKVIERLAFKTTGFNLKDGRCGTCGEKIPGVWR
ncbi:MAG: AmmeMemoRadiSam system radical SAM enzyme [Victivallales bacterium]